MHTGLKHHFYRSLACRSSSVFSYVSMHIRMFRAVFLKQGSTAKGQKTCTVLTYTERREHSPDLPLLVISSSLPRIILPPGNTECSPGHLPESCQPMT